MSGLLMVNSRLSRFGAIGLSCFEFVVALDFLLVLAFRFSSRINTHQPTNPAAADNDVLLFQLTFNSPSPIVFSPLYKSSLDEGTKFDIRKAATTVIGTIFSVATLLSEKLPP